ncbi:hypothetical protein [Methylobacterium planeticum]|uniref:Uncharacterized protein n=1 Tax=Methylobacterium planeticum TaxID=2615211 RepID=A0A6N6MRY2_9HYPH|nr:hypothetical protein [Methylobacterium planeticum]KAB1074307.1 hypothetical protein F6X51_07980 [Methylobacterium planeticum]
MHGFPLAAALSILQFAHSWYPLVCCSDEDCAPVEDVEQVKGGYRTHGYFIPTAEARPSQDARYHLCHHAGRLICFFVPLNG